MDTYRISAEALLRLAALASEAPAADPSAILKLLRDVEPDFASDAEPKLPDVAAGSALDGDEPADKPAKPE